MYNVFNEVINSFKTFICQKSGMMPANLIYIVFYGFRHVVPLSVP